MASECKLCVLLGTSGISENDGNEKTHSEVHAHQLELINYDFTVDQTTHSGVKCGQGPNRRSNRKMPALFSLCRELININGTGIQCSQCRKEIWSDRQTPPTSSNMINHACIHLNKDLCACRLCNLKFVSIGGVRSHLRYAHPLIVSSNSESYTDMTEDHKNDIMDMVKLCFGDGSKKHLKVTAFGKQKRNNLKQSPISKVGYRFLAKYQRGDLIQCHLCPRSISYGAFRAEAMMKLLDHSRLHLDKPIFSCSLCQYSASTEVTIRQHLKKSHSVAQSHKNFKDASMEYFEEISSMLEDCFGAKKETPPFPSKDQVLARAAQTRIRGKCGNNSLHGARRLRCLELIQTFQRSGNLKCRLCQEQIKVVTCGKTQLMEGAMRHIFSHLNKVLFKCRRCSYSSTTKNMIRNHVRSKHGVPETNEFDDHTDDHHSDFMDTLSNCFDWNLEPKKPAGSGCSDSTVSKKSKRMLIISKTQGNDLKAARHVLAYELIRKHATDGRMECRICSHSAQAAQKKNGYIRSELVLNHAVSHLDSGTWPFRCQVCSYLSFHQGGIYAHIKHAHKGKTGKEYEDASDKVHVETMECLPKCYDWSLEGRNIS